MIQNNPSHSNIIVSCIFKFNTYSDFLQYQAATVIYPDDVVYERIKEPLDNTNHKALTH